jgi:hypothetical protein
MRIIASVVAPAVGLFTGNPFLAAGAGFLGSAIEGGNRKKHFGAALGAGLGAYGGSQLGAYIPGMAVGKAFGRHIGAGIGSLWGYTNAQKNYRELERAEAEARQRNREYFGSYEIPSVENLKSFAREAAENVLEKYGLLRASPVKPEDLVKGGRSERKPEEAEEMEGFRRAFYNPYRSLLANAFKPLYGGRRFKELAKAAASNRNRHMHLVTFAGRMLPYV